MLEGFIQEKINVLVQHEHVDPVVARRAFTYALPKARALDNETLSTYFWTVLMANVYDYISHERHSMQALPVQKNF